MLSILAPLLLLAVAANARVLESMARPPRGWARARDALPAERLTLRIALRHPAALEQVVLAASTPGHAGYGRHLSRDQLRAFTAPDPRAVAEVSAWLAAAGVRDFAVEHDWVALNTTVAVADEMLGARFAWYEQVATKRDATPRRLPARQDERRQQLRTLSYGVPDDTAAKHIELVQPTTRFGGPSAQRVGYFESGDLGPATGEPSGSQGSRPLCSAVGAVEAPTAVELCNQTVGIGPQCLRVLYNVNYTASAGGQSGGVFVLPRAERTIRQLRYVPEAVTSDRRGQSFRMELINGAVNNQTSTADSGTPLVPTRDQPRESGNEPYIELLTYLLALPDSALPQTLSTSYAEEEQSVPREYSLKVCNMFMQLGARGVSVIFASGDTGPGNNCVSNADDATVVLGPTFPAGCPFVTSVGATAGAGPERAAAFSSGGFSIHHARPDYQDSAVRTYVNQTTNGVNFHVVDGGRDRLLSGTSASAPVFAGMVALLNAARRAAGLPPLGFLNPMLYRAAAAAAFADVVDGSSVGCRRETAAFGPGGARWNATAGWDPVTGLGTPRFDALLALAAPGVENN
ncbi:LOW QUALITY PROTEIN: hypothetical protein GGTG_03381 [Gaeumannomyces tritici R3-111a-1]|uniref:tripeptidyl-peptidase II n=1 Tax=Gaeumannomyces tritici (strain R3-111a-1) TaxID=644352 RepID=J3NQ23_GAET3|nr:LOW QUALITY PROTEIN: hypothetical protein GGTG_03381 [Gaeumannomyces tritici R3-111a-1]EJT78279.1 LOW QUALITY PROTEIN: hypothetical protein GGTG_03381 [Gaeumannomyces tritici R3-111a-1]